MMATPMKTLELYYPMIQFYPVILITLHWRYLLFQVVTVSYSRALTHNASKDIPENESPNADPQDDVDLDCDRIRHFDEISQDVIPVIQCEELKQSNKCITQGTVLTKLHT